MQTFHQTASLFVDLKTSVIGDFYLVDGSVSFGSDGSYEVAKVRVSYVR
jgi:hypothetical protein